MVAILRFCKFHFAIVLPVACVKIMPNKEKKLLEQMEMLKCFEMSNIKRIIGMKLWVMVISRYHVFFIWTLFLQWICMKFKTLSGRMDDFRMIFYISQLIESIWFEIRWNGFACMGLLFVLFSSQFTGFVMRPGCMNTNSSQIIWFGNRHWSRTIDMILIILRTAPKYLLFALPIFYISIVIQYQDQISPRRCLIWNAMYNFCANTQSNMWKWKESKITCYLYLQAQSSQLFNTMRNCSANSCFENILFRFHLCA